MKEFRNVSLMLKSDFATDPKRSIERAKRVMQERFPAEEFKSFGISLEDKPDRMIQITVVGQAKTKRAKKDDAEPKKGSDLEGDGQS